MQIVFDIEANSLKNPTKIHCIVAKELGSDRFWTWKNLLDDENEREHFSVWSSNVDLWIGHNILGYDLPVMSDLLKFDCRVEATRDTLILSRLIDFSRKGHSIENYGEEFGLEKIEFNDFKQWSPEMEAYCKRDVEICEKIYIKYKKYIDNPDHQAAIQLEHDFQWHIANAIERNGFYFNKKKAEQLLKEIEAALSVLDTDIEKAFPARLSLIREITPKVTKHGTLSKTDFRWVLDGDLSDFNGGPFCRCEWVRFNPSSHKQLVDVLSQAGWMPTDKTSGHIELEREISREKHWPVERRSVDFETKCAKLEHNRKYGWKINEQNLSTLPDTAPLPARSLAKRILLESRRRTLVEWLSLLDEDNRVRGRFQGIGTWTHRTATQRPNMQNIPNEFDIDGKVKPYGKEFRQLWCAPKNRLLVGVDAEGIQLRIFAHYIDDQEFTDALVNGDKKKKTDPHSLNQRILGSVCKSRAAAKRFIFAMLLGAGLSKLAEILGCSLPEAEEALDRLIRRYAGWQRLREEEIPRDGRRGYFIGLDGRKVAIPGETEGSRRHLAISGYLQNGEVVCMKYASLEWRRRLEEYKLLDEFKKLNYLLVDLIHDEWQTEVNNNMDLAILVARTQAEALKTVGERLGLKCPLAGSYWNDDHEDYTIGVNWYSTH